MPYFTIFKSNLFPSYELSVEETKKLDAVIASNTKIDTQIAKKYYTKEQKDPVLIDHDKLKKLGVELIEDDLIIIEDNILRHNSLKLSSLIFSYLICA